MEILKENKYYVYEHWLDGVCIYVGSGSVKNKRHSPNIKRNNFYEEKTLNRKHDIDVRIIKTFNDKIESLKFEEELTLKYKELGQAVCCIKQGNRGFKMTEENKLKISERMKKNNPSTLYGAPNKGINMNENQKKKISQTLLKKGEWYHKRIKCVENDKEFDNIYEAAKYYNVDIRIFKKCLKNNTMSKKLKLSFKFIE